MKDIMVKMDASSHAILKKRKKKLGDRGIRVGDHAEHKNGGYDFWHPAARVCDSTPDELPSGHILAPVVPLSEEEEPPRGVQVQPFDWKAWDTVCHAKGICQVYENNEYIPESEIESMEIQNKDFRRIWDQSYLTEVYLQTCTVSQRRIE